MKSYKNKAITRIEISKEFLSVYLSFKSSYFRKLFFFIIAFDEDPQKKCIFKGRLPKKSSLFILSDKETGKQIQANFYGNRRAGYILISIELLLPATKLLVKLEKLFGLFDNSDWINLNQPSFDFSKIIVVIPCYNVSRPSRNVPFLSKVKMSLFHLAFWFMVLY